MKTNLDKFFKTDDKLSSDGVEFALDDKTSFMVRHFNEQNPRVKAAMATYYKPHARQIELGTLPQQKGTEINHRIFIEVCLVSWTGVEDGDGQEISYTKENALALFKRLPPLFDALWKHANDFQNYREDLGNS